ncbi:DnaJ family domain-containing protein [Pantoea sp. 1.19]|uniref:DnaJ family domain-containing protein n=1 Tax=Pantoea sp. 1.19 TaxID=1925589 RepID=UPI0009489808|nr:DnaJ family domain-containing protein [Pantoea sp. 1.19]
MWLVDQLVEQHIARAREQGEFDNLPGAGKKLMLDDDSHVPENLRVGYRLLKNSGYLPPELALRREALALNQLLRELQPDDPERHAGARRLALLELRLQQSGMRTDFLHGEWRDAVADKLTGAE